MAEYDRDFREVCIAGQRFLAWPPTPPTNGQSVPRPDLEEQVIPLLKSRIPRPVLLYGPPGTGKTWLAERIATLLELPFYHWQIDASHQADDMLVILNIREDQQIERILSPIATAASAQAGPGLGFLDDAEKARDSGTLSSLIPILDRRPSVTLTRAAREMALHPDSRYIFACNDRRLLPRYFAQRPLPIEVPIPPLHVTLAMVRASGCIPEDDVVLELFVKAWKRPACGRDPTPREALNAVTWMKTFDDQVPGQLQKQRDRQDQIVRAVKDEDIDL